MDIERLEALERRAALQTDLVVTLAAKVHALALVTVALTGQLGAGVDRAALRRTALAGLGEGPEHAPAAALIEALTQEPVEALVDVQAAGSSAPAGSSRTLQ